MESRRPVIGVPSNLMVDAHSTLPGARRALVNEDYLQCIQAAGGLPVMLPHTAPAADLPGQLALVDGLLLSGGADVDPLTYGAQPEPGLGDVYPEMDAHQIGLIQAAWELGRPMFGICRGAQLLNVAFGGTLHQDLHRRPEGLLQHVQKGLRYAVSHAVDLEEGTRLRAIFGQAVLGTNSFHHQAIKDLAPGFRVSARARDGVVEGIERLDGKPVFGVQWHPEGMADRFPEMLRPFRALVEACAERRK